MMLTATAYTTNKPLTSPNKVFSIRPLTTRAASGSSSTTKLVVMIGVLMVLAAFIISLILGTPRVICEIELKQ